MFKKVVVALIPLSFIACNDTNNNGNIFISGEVEEGIDTLYLGGIESGQFKLLDTAAAVSGEYKFSIQDTSTIEFFAVQTDDQYAVPLFVKPGENVKLDISGKDKTRDYTVSGSEESERIKLISNITVKAMERVDSLEKVSSTYRDSSNYPVIRMQLDSAFENIVQDAKADLIAIVEEKPGSMANLFAFSQRLGNFSFISQEAEDLEYYEMVLAGLEETYPGSEHTESFKKSVTEMKLRAERSLTPGKVMPEIELTGPDGQSHSLSALRGKVVLVDFWAAWCKPCRVENPNLVRMYNEYSPKGFDVYSVSLDGLPQQTTPKEDWEKAIAQDGLLWPNHVSELKGWNSSVVQRFGFTGIPFTVLIDRDGKVIAVNLRGAQLEAKLKEVLG